MSKGKFFTDKYYNHVTKHSWQWRALRFICHASLLWRDCVCPLLPSNHAEHLHYKNLGMELPWFDIVPMNKYTHRIVTWLKDVIPGYRKINKWLLRATYLFWFYWEVQLLAYCWNAAKGFLVAIGLL